MIVRLMLSYHTLCPCPPSSTNEFFAITLLLAVLSIERGAHQVLNAVLPGHDHIGCSAQNYAMLHDAARFTHVVASCAGSAIGPHAQSKIRLPFVRNGVPSSRTNVLFRRLADCSKHCDITL